MKLSNKHYAERVGTNVFHLTGTIDWLLSSLKGFHYLKINGLRYGTYRTKLECKVGDVVSFEYSTFKLFRNIYLDTFKILEREGEVHIDGELKKRERDLLTNILKFDHEDPDPMVQEPTAVKQPRNFHTSIQELATTPEGTKIECIAVRRRKNMKWVLRFEFVENQFINVPKGKIGVYSQVFRNKNVGDLLNLKCLGHDALYEIIKMELLVK